MWSLVILCTHAGYLSAETTDRAIDDLTAIVEEDQNIFCAGSALDALSRLGHKHPNTSEDDARRARERTHDLLHSLPLRSWEPMLRSGIDAALVHDIENRDKDEPSPFTRRS